MKIKVEKWIMDREVNYKILEIKKCCDKLINSKNISLNSKFDEHDNYYDEDNDSNYSVKIVREEECNSYEDNWTDTFYETINYCPWCGGKINIEIVNIVNKTDEYKLLKKQREELWRKCCNTDSKKKEERLREQVRELDNKIDDMLRSDDFNERNEEFE